MKNNEIKKSDVVDTRVNSCGSGQWSINAIGEDGRILTSFMGSNGTNSKADNLWAWFDQWFESLPE